MSQATFDPTTPGGPSDDTGETPPTRSGQSARRRPSRRGHAASAKAAAETTAQPTAQPAAQATPEPAPVAPPVSAANPGATPAPAADETGAHTEGRSRRSRGGAKRAAPRGKAGAQLIIPKTGDEGQPEEAAATQPATSAAAESVAEPVSAVTEPVVVPVVTSEPAASTASTAPATAPRKTRFGLPRRLQQPGQPTLTPAPVATPVAEAEAAQPATEAPAAPTAQAETPAEAPAPRYRFDRSRRVTVPGVGAARPEHLGAQGASLYTAPAAANTSANAAPANPPAATEHLFDLPPLESLVSREAGADLPALAFDEPAVAQAGATADEAEQIEEGTDAAELAEGAEGAAASSRRRRRRRRSAPAHNGAHGAEADEAAEDEGQPTPTSDALDALYDEEPAVAPSEPYYEEPPRETRSAYGEPTAQRGRNGRYGYSTRTPRRATAEPTWEAPTQQPAPEEPSPYSSPEPSFARGFGPTPNGAAMPVRESYPRPSRVERGADATAATVAQLGSVIREAINTQTDRLLTELRHQQPPAVTLSIPNAQTTERVAVFVDVANVVYSARGLRTSVDFGRLLDFLRANRRLARAQAYAPTDPTPGGEQAFLNAVKGLGYRITTKNYKTFANGAKKADLDLDLCMDIVRIVESKAVDTIVLVSGDSDFLPLLDFCTDHGVRVEVAAFDDAASMILRQSCDLFVNLSLVDGIRG